MPFFVAKRFSSHTAKISHVKIGRVGGAFGSKENQSGVYK